MTFKVKIIKDANKQPIGVRAAKVNGRDVVLALRDSGLKTWDEAVKIGVPSIAEWAEIYKNKESVNKALIKSGGEPLKDECYWSCTMDSYLDSCSWRLLMSNGACGSFFKYTYHYVRPALAL